MLQSQDQNIAFVDNVFDDFDPIDDEDNDQTVGTD